jgi:hypothetical protein
MAVAYTKKVETAEAVQFDGTNGAEIDAWLGSEYDVMIAGLPTNQQVTLCADPSVNRRWHLSKDLWVIQKSTTVILDFMSSEQFNATYEPV